MCCWQLFPFENYLLQSRHKKPKCILSAKYPSSPFKLMMQSTSGRKKEWTDIMWSRFFFMPSWSLLQNRHTLKESSVVLVTFSEALSTSLILEGSLTTDSASPSLVWGFLCVIRFSRLVGFLVDSWWKLLNRDDWLASGLFAMYSFSLFLCNFDDLCDSSCSLDLKCFLQGSHFQILSCEMRD